MPVLGAATLELNADSARLEQDLGRAVGQATAFGAAIGQVLGQAISAGVDKLTHMVNKAIETGDELNKLSQKTGMTVESLSELRISAELSNVSIGALKTGITQLYQHLSEAGRSSGGKANAAFEAIGLDIEKLRELKPDELFRTVTTQLAKYEDGANRAAIQTAILGRSGNELSPFINELGKTNEIAKSLGITMTKEMAEASERFKDNMTISRIASEAMGLRIAEVLLPTLEKLSGYLVDNAKNTERLDNVTRAADTGLKLFATAGTVVATVFQIVADKIAAAFASISLAASGDFKEAFKTVGSSILQTGEKIGEAVAQIQLTWEDGANKALAGAERNGAKLAAPAIEAVEKIKKARKEADVEFQAFLKVHAIEEEAGRATQDYYRKQGEETTRITQIAIEQKQQLFEMMEKIRYSAAHGGDTGVVFDEDTSGFTKVTKQVEKTNDFAKQMGLTFSSAFEEAVRGGKKLSDVLKGLSSDILGVILRKSVTEPLGNYISGAVSGMFGGGGSGGAGIAEFFSNLFRADGGPVTGGKPYIVGERGPELFMPGSSGMIVPNGAFAGGQQNVNITFQVNSLDPRSAASVLVQNKEVITHIIRQATNERGRTAAF